ncbi:hypothetical protein Aduo_012460 [Ancylostoma duodenale]
MTSFASFISTDSFNFSANFMFGTITKEDEEVWTAYSLARKRPTKEAKEDFVKGWIASNECYWKGSSLRVNLVGHKSRREEEARLVGDAGTVKEVVEDAKDAKESDEGKEAAPGEESPTHASTTTRPNYSNARNRGWDRQTDGFNFGAFVCIYTERLLHGLPTKSEEPLYDFLFSARHIYHCLCRSFAISERTADQIASLRRLFNYLSDEQYTLRLQLNEDVPTEQHLQTPEENSLVAGPGTSSQATTPLISQTHDAPHAATSCISQAADRSEDCVRHVLLPQDRHDVEAERPPKPHSHALDLQIFAADVPPTSVVSQTVTVDETVFFLQLQFKFSPDVAVINSSLPFVVPRGEHHSRSINGHASTGRSYSNRLLLQQVRASLQCCISEIFSEVSRYCFRFLSNAY